MFSASRAKAGWLTLRTVEWLFALATVVFVSVSTRRVSTRAAVLTTALVVTLLAMLAGRGVAGIFSDTGDASRWRQWAAGTVLVDVRMGQAAALSGRGCS